MKFLVRLDMGMGNVKRLTVSDTSQTCAMQRVKKWVRDNHVECSDISVIPMNGGCYTPGALEAYRI
jgi:hypothetical protein